MPHHINNASAKEINENDSEDLAKEIRGLDYLSEEGVRNKAAGLIREVHALNLLLNVPSGPSTSSPKAVIPAPPNSEKYVDEKFRLIQLYLNKADGNFIDPETGKKWHQVYFWDKNGFTQKLQNLSNQLKSIRNQAQATANNYNMQQQQQPNQMLPPPAPNSTGVSEVNTDVSTSSINSNVPAQSDNNSQAILNNLMAALSNNLQYASTPRGRGRGRGRGFRNNFQHPPRGGGAAGVLTVQPPSNSNAPRSNNMNI